MREHLRTAFDLSRSMEDCIREIIDMLNKGDDPEDIKVKALHLESLAYQNCEVMTDISLSI